MQRFQFSLRTLMLVVTLVCFTLWAVPAAIEWRRQQQIEQLIRDNVTKTFEKLVNESEGSYHLYTFARDDVYDQYHLSTREIVKDSQGLGAVSTGELRRPGSVCVYPPGHWASTPEEAIQLLKDNL